MREILFSVAFVAFTYVMAGIIGQTLLCLSQPTGLDFFVPTKRAIKFGYFTFLVGIGTILIACISLIYNENNN